MAIKGWTEITEQPAVKFALHVQKCGVEKIIYTDIARDGMLSGVNVNAVKDMLEQTDLHIIASGGVASVEDVQNLLNLDHPRLEGLIIGKALYEGQFDLQRAVALVSE